MRHGIALHRTAFAALMLTALPAAALAGDTPGAVDAAEAAALPSPASTRATPARGDSAETLAEQALASAAELAPPFADVQPAPGAGVPEGTGGPLFIGVDDVTVSTYRVDVTTGTPTPQFTGFQVWGAAYDPAGDRVYFNNGSTLYEWPVGGSVATLGTIVDSGGVTQSMVALAYHNGVLYGAKNIANEAVWTIDPTTLIATVLIDYVDADYDFGGLSIDPATGEIYGTNDDASPHGSGLFRINNDATATLIAPYPAGQTDIDGLAVGGGFAYLVTDEPGSIYVWDFAGGAYATPLPNPWASSEVFSAGAWIQSGPSAPDIQVDPASLASQLPAGGTETQPLDISNVGTAALDWTVDEAAIPLRAGARRGIEAVLHDNGPLVTHPGGGFGGADASALQTAIGLNVYGFGHAVATGFRLADDFTVPGPAPWSITDITFFAYQTGSTTTSTITDVNLRIWDGPPGQAGSNIVYGDTTTNRLATSTFTNIYRAIDTSLLDSNRPIMADVVTVNTTLPPGTYWLDWQTGGSLASGPWAPPVSIVGQAVTGNGLQYDPTAATWNPLIDTGTAAAQQDLPFVIEGTASPCDTPSDLPWVSASPNAGTTQPGQTSTVDVTFDATGLTAGLYEGLLCVDSNDPDTARVEVPVSLEVLVDPMPFFGDFETGDTSQWSAVVP